MSLYLKKSFKIHEADMKDMDKKAVVYMHNEILLSH